MRAYEFPTSDTPVWRGRKVAVVGGGNVAMDAARTALRLGAEEVFLVYRRTEDEMPARREEVHHAREEGVEFKMLCSPVEIVGHDGWVTGHHRDAHGARRAGRERPARAGVRAWTASSPSTATRSSRRSGTRANPLLQAGGARSSSSRSRGYIVTDDDGATNLPGVFAGGDIVTGAATVILAMGAGKKAARGDGPLAAVAGLDR